MRFLLFTCPLLVDLVIYHDRRVIFDIDNIAREGSQHLCSPDFAEFLVEKSACVARNLLVPARVRSKNSAELRRERRKSTICISS
jgi:hypothetical protein